MNHYWRGIEPVAGDVPPARFGHTAAYYDQYMYVYGGGDNVSNIVCVGGGGRVRVKGEGDRLPYLLLL